MKSEFYILGWQSADWGYTEEIGMPQGLSEDQQREYSKGYRACKSWDVVFRIMFSLSLLLAFVLLAVFVIK